MKPLKPSYANNDPFKNRKQFNRAGLNQLSEATRLGRDAAMHDEPGVPAQNRKFAAFMKDLESGRDRESGPVMSTVVTPLGEASRNHVTTVWLDAYRKQLMSKPVDGWSPDENKDLPSNKPHFAFESTGSAMDIHQISDALASQGVKHIVVQAIAAAPGIRVPVLSKWKTRRIGDDHVWDTIWDFKLGESRDPAFAGKPHMIQIKSRNTGFIVTFYIAAHKGGEPTTKLLNKLGNLEKPTIEALRKDEKLYIYDSEENARKAVVKFCKQNPSWFASTTTTASASGSDFVTWLRAQKLGSKAMQEKFKTSILKANHLDAHKAREDWLMRLELHHSGTAELDKSQVTKYVTALRVYADYIEPDLYKRLESKKATATASEDTVWICKGVKDRVTAPSAEKALAEYASKYGKRGKLILSENKRENDMLVFARGCKMFKGTFAEIAAKLK